MPPFLVPARSSRHRTACFALYRALLRQVRQVPLPDEVVTGFGRGDHPVKHLIRAGFRRNRADTSPRLVTAALTNGYRFLGLLSAARAPSSPEHGAVLGYLHERLGRYRRNAARHPPPTPAPSRPRPPPLLTRRPGGQGGRPAYVPTSRPRPLPEIKGGVRKVPKLAHTNGFPFLRLGKPQPPALGRALGRGKELRQGWISQIMRLNEAGRSDAALEDRWEDLVREQMRREGKDAGAAADPALERQDAAAKYVHSVGLSVRRLSEKANEQRIDMVARMAALVKIVEAETALAEQEAKERAEKGRG